MVKRDNSKDAFSKRLSTACKYAGVDGRGVGVSIVKALQDKAIRVSGPAVWKWLNGAGMPDSRKIVALSEWLGVRAEWLEYGVGDMITGVNSDSPPSKEAVMQEILSPRQLTILKLFEKLPESEQAQLVESLTEKKQHYDKLFEELAKSRSKKVS